LIGLGRFDATRTPTGADFSGFRTYANTKRAFAEATRALAAQHPTVQFAVVHPGVARTELGARPGLMGKVLGVLKRGWKPPETCAKRLAQRLDDALWSEPGTAAWFFEGARADWPV